MQRQPCQLAPLPGPAAVDCRAQNGACATCARLCVAAHARRGAERAAPAPAQQAQHMTRCAVCMHAELDFTNPAGVSSPRQQPVLDATHTVEGRSQAGSLPGRRPPRQAASAVVAAKQCGQTVSAGAPAACSPAPASQGSRRRGPWSRSKICREPAMAHAPQELTITNQPCPTPMRPKLQTWSLVGWVP